MIRPPSEFNTPRLHLRVAEIDDAESIFEEYAADQEVTRYMTWVPHTSSDSVVEFLKALTQRHEDGMEFSWVIEKPDTGRAFGMIGVFVREHKAGLGYVLAKRFWNRGYMTEVISVVSDWLLSQPEIFRVWAVCDTENSGSARALEKAGFEREGLLRRWVVLPNCSDEPRDCYIYGKTT